MSKTKLNVLIGVLTGVLVGFVSGAAFGTSNGKPLSTNGNGAGDISRVSALGKFRPGSWKPLDSSDKETSDTLRYEAVDENGNDIEILIINN